MSAGFVYVAENPAMPDIVKIGVTSKWPERRLAQLSNTSVPLPFTLYGSVWADHPYELEQLVHRDLDDIRVNDSREFFHCLASSAHSYIIGGYFYMYDGDIDACAESFSLFKSRNPR